MTGREQAVGAALAAVLVIGIIDTAAGHNGSPKSTPAGLPRATTSPTLSTAPSPTPRVLTPTPHPRHTHTSGMATATTPATSPPAASGSTTAPAPSATRSRSATESGVLGTFRYRTTGHEQTNIPGTARSYPSTTKITNKLKGCGVQSTWKPVSEHVQKQLVCPSGKALKIRSYITSISYYGVTNGEHFTCSGPSYVYQPNVSAGTVWKYRCKSSDATASQTAKVIGYQTIDVGGTPVRTLHVHVDTTLEGSSSGTSAQDYWIATNKPILVKQTGTVDAQQKNVHYSEVYSLALKSLSPKT